MQNSELLLTIILPFFIIGFFHAYGAVDLNSEFLQDPSYIKNGSISLYFPQGASQTLLGNQSTISDLANFTGDFDCADGQVWVARATGYACEDQSASGDAITEGDSNVEIIDAGTGQIDFDLDGSLFARISGFLFNLQQNALSGVSYIINGSNALMWPQGGSQTLLGNQSSITDLVNVTRGCAIYQNYVVNSAGNWECDNNKLIATAVRNPQPPQGNTTVLFNFNSTMAQGFDVTGAGTWSNDTTDFISGDQSLQLVTTGDATNNDYSRNGILVPYDTTGKHCGFWVKVDSVANLAWFQFFMGQGSSINWAMRISDYSSLFQDDQWVFISAPFGQWNISGSPTRDSMDYLLIRIRDDGTAITANVDSIQCFPERQSAIVLRFDDSKKTHWTEARPYLNNYGLKGTFFVIPENLGGANLNVDEALKMQREGHQIASHGVTELQSLGGEDAIINELIKIKEQMMEYGLQGYDDFVYPGGGYDNDTLNVVPKFFRSSQVFQGSDESSPPGDLFRIRVNVANAASTCSAEKSVIDEAMLSHSLHVIGFHSIVAGASGSDITPEVFRCIIDHIAVNNYPVMTMAEYFGNMRSNNINTGD